MIEIKNLYLSFTKEYDALHNISLSVKDGQKVALVGDADSGKTMLLRTLAGLEKFESGEVLIKNFNIKKIDFKQDVSIGFVPKSFILLDKKTVKENLEYVLKIRNMDMATINLKVLTALKYFGIEALQNLKVKDLSNYQKTLLQLARVSMRKVDLFLIDDIFEGLTESEGKNIMAKVKVLLEENANSTFVFAFRDISHAQELNLDVIKLKYGCIVD
ncbi:MAG: ATP-binding cassette domain-containing protein [Christensenellales bacterium]